MTWSTAITRAARSQRCREGQRGGSHAWLMLAALAMMIGPAQAQDQILADDFPVEPRHNIWSEPPPTPDWTRHVRVGVLVGFNIKATFSMSGQFAVSGNNPGAPGVSGVDHFYDDGYVRVDDFNNAGTFTSYWGYDNASQYQGGSQTLLMHSASAFITRGGSEAEDSPYVGFDLAYGGNLWNWGPTKIGWEFGFGVLPLGISENKKLPAIVSQSTYSFDTAGIQMPTAPYNGGPSGQGPTIHDIGTLVGTATTPGTVTGSRTLDVELYSFRLGPTVYWDFNHFLGMSVGFGPALGFVAGEYEFNEMINTGSGSARNRGHISASELVYGGYVNATLVYHAIENGDFYIGAQYMPMTEATVEGGGREARLDPKGQIYFSAGINWPF